MVPTMVVPTMVVPTMMVPAMMNTTTETTAETTTTTETTTVEITTATETSTITETTTTLQEDGNSNSKDIATKILGLNVCGLRSKVNNGIFDEYAKQFAIICLSETKLAKNTDIDLTGTNLNDYLCITKEKTIKSHQYGGVHGICMLIRNNIVNHSKIITGVKSPYVLWVQFSKEAFGFSCVIGSVYLPCTKTHKDPEMFESIYEDIFYLKGILELPICLVGDMNSRTGELDDILTFEREVIHSCETNDITDFFVDDCSDLSFFEDNNIISRKRANKDKTLNENGKDLINLCKRNNMIIMNGRTGSDREIGKVTFQSKNGKSTIDYCITSPDFIRHIQDFQVDILDQNLSDKHSPIILTLKTKLSENPINSNDIPDESDINYDRLHSKWDEEKMPEFQNNFDQTKINNLCQMLEHIEINGSDLQEINKIVDETANVSISAGINSNMSKKPTSETKPKLVKKENKPWFDRECQEKRRHFIQIKRQNHKITLKLLNFELNFIKNSFK